MEYIRGALAILFPLFFIGSMLLVVFWEKDAKDIDKQEKPREQEQQSQVPIKEVERPHSATPELMGSRTSGGNQQTAKTLGDDERRRRKKHRRR